MHNINLFEKLNLLIEFLNKLRNSSLLSTPLIRTLFKFFSLIISRILFGRKKSINIGNEYTFFLNSKFAFSGWEKWGEGHNKGFRKLLELASNNSTVFDVGAHIGLCSLPLSRKAKFIYAFEPSKVNRKYLKQHLTFNEIENIKVIEDLLGKNNLEEVSFFETKDVSGIPSITDLSKISTSVKGVKEKKLRQISLDYFCEVNDVIPDLIKIDVEGAEFNVLEGASKIIKENRPEIIISLHPKHLNALGRHISEIFNFCEIFSYELLSCNNMREIKRAELSLDEYYMKPT